MKTKFFSLLAVATLCVLLCGCGKKEPKVLTVYFSHWGGTEILANMIHLSVGGDLFIIEPEVPYPAEGTHAAVQKQLDAGELPTLKKKVENLDAYDVVFIGTPNWFNTMALPVKVFLQENDLAGKKIVPFATYGGSVGETLTDVVKLCPQSTALTGFAVSGDEVKGDKEAVKVRVEEWLNTIKPEFRP
jgi:flavodoxin